MLRKKVVLYIIGISYALCLCSCSVFVKPSNEDVVSAAHHRFRQTGYPKFPVTGQENAKSLLTCGKRRVTHFPPKSIPDEPLQKTPKIVGGVPVPYGAYPWTVHIESLTYDGFEHACGGTIVSEHFVVTAAHCIHGYGFQEVRIKVGDYDSKKKDRSEAIFETEQWKVHPNFQKGGTYNNDIAVIKVKPFMGKGIQFNEFVSPACLPDKSTSYPPGTWCYVSGWGLTSSNSFLPSNLLRAATVPLLPKKICRSRNVFGTRRIKPGMLCAGYLQGEIDACDGDSGGPLVCKIDGHHTLLGVVSWGVDCAKKNKPGIYSDVQYYLGFIQEAMTDME